MNQSTSAIETPQPRTITAQEVSALYNIDPALVSHLFSDGSIPNRQKTGDPEGIADLLDVYRHFESEKAGKHRRLPEEVDLSKLVHFHEVCTTEDAHPSLVQKYAEQMMYGTKFPPAIAFRQKNGTLLVVDGRHRIQAAKLAGKETFHCHVRLGTVAHQTLCALAANGTNGRPRSASESSAAVAKVIQEFGDLSLRRIGLLVGLSHVAVRKIKKRLEREKSGNGTSQMPKPLVTKPLRKQSNPLADLEVTTILPLDTQEKIMDAVLQVLDKAPHTPRRAASALRKVAQYVERLQPSDPRGVTK